MSIRDNIKSILKTDKLVYEISSWMRKAMWQASTELLMKWIWT